MIAVPETEPRATELMPAATGARERENSFRDVLVVEDSAVERQRMEAMLRRLGYEVTAAPDGRHALEILRSRPIPLVLSDWRMPEMSGIDLCRTLRTDSSLGQPYVILVTGRNRPDDLVAGMDAGADDFIGKPFNAEELRVRLQAGVRLLALRGEAQRRNVELATALKREAQASLAMRRDLSVAASLQRESLPQGSSPFREVEVATLFRAAAHVAGDGYGYFPLDDRHLGFFLIDVAGHGVASAMLSFTVCRYLMPGTGAIPLTCEPVRGKGDPSPLLPSHIVPPGRVVDALNRRFVDTSECRYFFTIVYGVLDVSSGRGELCQAGHPHPLIVDGGGAVERVGEGGFPVGMLAQATYESVPFALERGERLYLYSDGLTDCAGFDGELFGEERLAALLGQVAGHSSSDSVRAVERDVLAWRTGDDDDMSMLVIERLASPRSGAAQAR